MGSLYFINSIFTTIGFGDVSAENEYEMVIERPPVLDHIARCAPHMTRAIGFSPLCPPYDASHRASYGARVIYSRWSRRALCSPRSKVLFTDIGFGDVSAENEYEMVDPLSDEVPSWIG